MNELTRNYTDNNTGISYTLVGDYYLPDLKAPTLDVGTLGRFGRERFDYLKQHRRLLYLNLLTSGKLNDHLHETDATANDRMDFISRQIAENEDVTEKLKADNTMLWVQKVNSIRNRVIEIIRDELIYS